MKTSPIRNHWLTEKVWTGLGRTKSGKLEGTLAARAETLVITRLGSFGGKSFYVQKSTKGGQIQALRISMGPYSWPTYEDF